jgi:N-acetylmuramoyl-L-alanine amidase
MQATSYVNLTPEELMELCVYREARGEGMIGKRGVAWTIQNRATHPSWWGHDIRGVVTKPFQFSSFNADDPNSNVWPEDSDAFQDCITACSGVLAGTDTDPTQGAQYYHDISIETPLAWVNAGYQLTLAVGRLKFFRQ